MINFIAKLFAILILIVGMISMVTPIPGGVLMITGGLTILICTSPRARICLRWFRTRSSWLNKSLFWMEKKVGSRVKLIGDALAQTHPLSSNLTTPLKESTKSSNPEN